MWALWLASAALAGACLATAACWALWRRARARHNADLALERITADAEHQQARRALYALAQHARHAAPAQRTSLDLRLWDWENGGAP